MPISPSPSSAKLAGSGTLVFIANVDWPPLAPYETVTELLKLKGLVVSTEVPPPPEKLPPAPPVKEPRLMSVFPLNNDEAVMVPFVVPPIPVRTPELGPDGLVKPVSVKVRVNDPAPELDKSIELKSRVAMDVVPGALDLPVAMKATQEPKPPSKPILPVALL